MEPGGSDVRVQMAAVDGYIFPQPAQQDEVKEEYDTDFKLAYCRGPCVDAV